MSYYPKQHTYSKNKIEAELDLVHYTAKSDLETNSRVG